MVNYFGKYSSREEYIVNIWIKNFFRGNAQNIKYIISNTGFHDGKINFHYAGKEYELTVQVKEEEFYWYSKTGNLGFDFLSAFNFKAQNQDSLIELKKKHFEINKYWVTKNNIKFFLKNEITIGKYGKLLTCDADIHIFYVENKSKLEFVKAYSNYYLQSKKFMEYIFSKYDLRINKKVDYGIEDNRESAAFFVKPNDKYVKKTELNDIENIVKIINKRETLKGYKFNIDSYLSN